MARVITIAQAITEADVVDAVDACYQSVEAGQVGFGLSGQGSRAALLAAWLRLLEHPEDLVLIARDGSDVVGACGFLVSDATQLQTVNGPIAVRETDAVFSALVDDVAARFPGAELLMGVSHRHQPALDWALSHGDLVEHTWPYQGVTDAVSEGARGVVANDFEKARFCATYDASVGTDLWWTSARIRTTWTEWICIVDDQWQHALAARVFPTMSMTEAFGISPTADAETTHALMSTWISTAAQRGIRQAVIFAETPQQREAAEVLGLRCQDEYLAWRIPRETHLANN